MTHESPLNRQTLMMKKPLILASTSPFRRQILEKLAIDFITAAPSCDETRLNEESPSDMVQRLALEKARSLQKKHSKALIIGSDQCAEIHGDILGKPDDHATAIKQLTRCSGEMVQFHTGLCLFNAASGEYQLENVPFAVTFRHLTQQQIEAYLLAEKPYNCAGSFKSEGMGIVLFEQLKGDDPNTLMGLPLIRLISMLAKEGLSLPLS